MEKTLNLVDLLKTHTKIDHEFLDLFFQKFNIGDDLHFDIHEDEICKYLTCRLRYRLTQMNYCMF